MQQQPELRRGSHPDPSAGACFMEYASLLAGEPWSDHPRCTHPALAQLARLINDAASSPGRQLLTPLVPEAVGVKGPDAAIAVLHATSWSWSGSGAGPGRPYCHGPRDSSPPHMASHANGSWRKHLPFPPSRSRGPIDRS